MSASKTRHPEKRLTPLEGAVTSTHKRQWCGLEEGVDDGGERLGCSVGRKGQQPMINTSKAVSKLQLQCREIESGWGGAKRKPAERHAANREQRVMLTKQNKFRAAMLNAC